MLIFVWTKILESESDEDLIIKRSILLIRVFAPFRISCLVFPLVNGDADWRYSDKYFYESWERHFADDYWETVDSD